MSADARGLSAWETLFAAWQQANEDARFARTQLTQAFVTPQTGDDRPIDEELKRVQMLEGLADRLSLELDQLAPR